MSKTDNGLARKKDLKTANPNVRCHINYKKQPDGRVRMSAYLINEKYRTKLGKNIGGSTMARNENEVEQNERYLMTRLMQAYAATQKDQKRKKEPETDHPFSDAYQSIPPHLRRQLCPATWRAASTINQGLAYFENKILPMLDACGRNPSAEDLNDLIAKIKELCLNNKNSNKSALLAENKVYQHIMDFNRLYPRLLELAPEYDLPMIELPMAQRNKYIQEELGKAIPEEVRIRFTALLERLLSNGLTMGGVIMMTALARTAEACAPKFGEIRIMGDYAVYGVIWQSDGKIRMADLKTENSYRMIILPKFAVDCLCQRMTYLCTLGYTEEAIRDMYVVTDKEDPEKMAVPSDLSEYLRELLVLAGYQNSAWKSVDLLMNQEPDYDEKQQISYDASAYILRRNGCTLLCNVCGMNSDLVDALMGHKPTRSCHQNWKKALRQLDRWPVIARMLERVVYDPAHSANPRFAPVTLQNGTSYVMQEGQIACQLTAAEELEVELTVETMEVGDTLTLRTTGAKIQAIESQTVKFEGGNAYAIGLTRDRPYYEQYLQQGNEIDLSKYLPPNQNTDSETSSTIGEEASYENGEN